MDHIITFIPMLSLQVFADGGAGGAAGAGSGDGGTAQGTGVNAGAAAQRKGVKGNSLANVVYGIQTEEEAAPDAEVQETTEEQPNLEEEFEALIKGKYKDVYGSRVQSTIQNRLKSANSHIAELTGKQDAVAPILEMLAGKYGVDATDIKALSDAIQNDDSYFEQEAMEKGMTVEQLKSIRKMERENAELRKMQQDQQSRERANQLYQNWMTQAEDAKAVYPRFDLRTEMANSQFLDLLKAGIDVKTAYEVVHKDEIIPAAMQHAARTIESKISRKIAAQGARPPENGASGGSPAVVKSDVSKLTKQDIAEISRRVARGEKISFG